jgi:hypothetical protein
VRPILAAPGLKDSDLLANVRLMIYNQADLQEKACNIRSLLENLILRIGNDGNVDGVY